MFGFFVQLFLMPTSTKNQLYKNPNRLFTKIKLITLAFGSESYLQTNLPVLGLPWQRVPLTPPDGQRRPLSQPQVDVGELLDRGAASREITDFVPTNLDGSTRNGCQCKS